MNKKIKLLFRPGVIAFLLFLVSCGKPFVRKAPVDEFYLYKNIIEVKEGNFTKAEKSSLIQRLYAQLDDSAKVKITRRFVLLNFINKPTRYDTASTVKSVGNIKASMFHLGYYNAAVDCRTDTAGKKITVNYLVKSGKPTLIDTLSYRFLKPELQALGIHYKRNSYLKKNAPVTKVGVLSEINRLVDSFRNNGYYKFTAAELKVKGDTSIEALTSVSNDPFEQLQLIADAMKKRDDPKIKLAVVLNPPADTTRLNKYSINDIYILPDYRQGDDVSDTFRLKQRQSKYFTIRYHYPLFNEKLFDRIVTFRKGDLFRQTEYFNTLSNISKIGIWQSTNIRLIEAGDSGNLVNLVIELIPIKKFGFESALELSYSASSNTSNILAGNLFGLSGNLSLSDRNLAREAIRMTHNIRAGLELNSNNRGIDNRLINSNVISYANTTSFPRLLFKAIPNAFSRNKQNNGETFINAGFSYNTRFNLFNLRSFNASFGWTGINRKNWKWAWSPLNTGFSFLFNQTDSFKTIVNQNPFLQFSYNTAFVAGMRLGLSKTIVDFYHPNSVSKELTTRFNIEESGLTWGLMPLFNKYKRRYIRADAEIIHAIKYEKTALAFRGFLGVGVPLLGSDTNRTLPFFKQYFGGGSNSMRAWPVRGIGPGGRPLIPFSSTKTIFNDRTGDVQLELNAEYRYDIIRIIPNTLTLRGAIFADIGNIWNLRNTKADGSADSAQISFKNLYRQLGVAAGTGFRLDFSYFIVRLDFGFRFKRPELFYINDGWKAPDIGFNDLFKKIFARGVNDEYRKWRYENFNFTIGIGYSF